MNGESNALEKRLDAVEAQLRELTTTIDQLKARPSLDDVDARLVALEQKIDSFDRHQLPLILSEIQRNGQATAELAGAVAGLGGSVNRLVSKVEQLVDNRRRTPAPFPPASEAPTNPEVRVVKEAKK